MTETTSPALLTEQQRADFDRDGFLLVRNALSPDRLGRIVAAVDRLYEEGVGHEGLSERNHWQMRNCIGADPAFLD